MEEILASIRRIIADDDATKSPPNASEPVAAPPAPMPPRPATLPPRMTAPPAPPPPRPAAPPPRPAPRPDEAALKQAEIDAMLAQLQASSPPAPAPAEPAASDILDLTEQMAAPAPARDFAPSTVSRTWCSRRTPLPEPAPVRAIDDRRPAPERSGERGLISAATSRGRRFRLQHAGADGAGAERPHARGPGAGNAAADAQDLARRQSAGNGRAPGAGRDRTGLARPRITANSE